MPKEVEALRASLDSRLAALEQALADPTQHTLLEPLILDLARVATEEADATTRHAVAEAQAAAQAVAEAARAETAKALEEEQVEAAALRHVIEEAKAALKQAEAALKEERRAAEAANRDAAGARRELDAIRASVEEERSSRAAQRRELDAALAAVESERVRVSAAEQHIAQARAQGESERAALASQLDEQRAAIEGERAAAAQLRQTTEELERQIGAGQSQLEAMRRELESTRGERDATQHTLEAVRRDLDGMRQDSDARTTTLSHSQAEQERVLRAAQDAARSAEARLDEAMRARDAARGEAVQLKEQLQFAESAIRERDALKRELETAHAARDAAEILDAARSTTLGGDIDVDSETVVDLTSITREEERQLAIENRFRALELALRDAETRAELAELELERHRRTSPAKRDVPAPAAVSPPQAVEQFRSPSRGATRVAFKGEFEIQVDGTPAKLVDLSTTGAQLWTTSAMRPNRLINVTLPIGDSPIVCKAKVMWSRIEPRAGQLWYRAGVSFTSPDQVALETFLSRHQT